jgi:hypothetical protein
MTAEIDAGYLRSRLVRHAAWIILALGFLIRCFWLSRHAPPNFAVGEAANVAISIARDGSFADTFARGSGLSAHFTPSMTLVTGLVYALFGVHSFASEAILAVLSISLSLTSAWLWYRIIQEIGAPRLAALAALALFCILPMNFTNEAIAFRAWEGGLATAGAAWCLLLALRIDKDPAPTLKRFAGLAVISAVTFYVSQAIGLAVYGTMGLLLLRRFEVRRWPAAIGIAALCLVVALAPWTIRNAVAFDRFIPLRSNLGLELALANYPGALAAKNERADFLERLRAIHPLESDAAFQTMMRAGGEIPYADALGKQAKAWIAAHPDQFARLSARHLSEFYFPRAWQWNVYSDRAQGVRARQALFWLLSSVGLLAALLLPWLYGSRALYPTIFAVVPALPYLIVQPILRYNYLVFAPLLFCAVALAFWPLAQRWGRLRPRDAVGLDRPSD